MHYSGRDARKAFKVKKKALLENHSSGNAFFIAFKDLGSTLRIKWILFACICLVVPFSVLPSSLTGQIAEAAPADTLNFQGRLLDSSGGLTSDGFYDIEFNLYDNASGGSSLWTETWNTGTSQVRIANGYFSVYLGTHTSFPSLDWTDDKFLTMNVEGDGEMNPRFRLTAVPYAFAAQQATELVASDSGFTTNVTVDTPTQNNSITLPDESGEVCLTSGNCAGVGGVGDILDGGQTGAISIGTTNDTTLTLLQNNNAALTVNSSQLLQFNAYSCSTFANGGTLTTDASGNVICADDDGGGGGSGVTTIGTIDGGTLSSNGASISGTTLYLQAASTLYPGLVTTGSQTFAGSKTFNSPAVFQDLTISAGESLQINSEWFGDLTGNGLTNSGSALTVLVQANKGLEVDSNGISLIDCADGQILQYATGSSSWACADTAGTGSDEIITVAAVDSTATQKAAADYVADGTSDETEINNALTEAYNSGVGGEVILLGGTFTVDGSISIPNNTTLSGEGSGTVIELDNLDSDINLITNTDTSGGTGVVVRDLTLDGRSDLNTAGNQFAILFSGMGSVSADRAGGLIENVSIVDFSPAGGFFYGGIALNGSDNNVISGNTLEGNGFGVYVGGSSKNKITDNYISGGNLGIYAQLTSNDNVIADNTISEHSLHGIHFDSSGTGTAITGNTIENNDQFGVYLENGFYYASIVGNTITSNDYGGIYLDIAHGSTIAGNTFDGNAGAVSTYAATDNTIVGNTITNSSIGGVYLEQSDTNIVSDNIFTNNAGDNIYLESDSNNNTISNNIITDSAASGFAIEINGATNDNNYLSNNTYSGTGAAGINDSGTNTIYAGQVDTSGNYDIQPTGTVELLANTNLTGDFDVTGTTSFDGAVTIGDAVGDTLTVNAGSIQFANNFVSCTAINSDASGNLGCDTNTYLTAGTISLQGSYDGGNTILADNAGGDIDFTVSEATSFTVDITGTGSFQVQDSGVAVFTIADGGAVTATQLVTLNGGLTVEAGDTFTFNNDAFTDLTGTGLQINSGSLETTLGTTIETSEITDANVTNSKLANSQLAVNTGSGLAGGGNISLGGSRTLSLGDLSSDWTQAGGYDIILDNAGSELRIVEASGGIYYGEFDVTDLNADRLYTFPDASGEVSVLGQIIENGELQNSNVTITAGTGLSGGGLVALGGSVSLTSTLGSSIDGTEIDNGTIEAIDFEVTAAPTDNYVLSYDSATGGFTWVDPGAVGTQLTEAEVEDYIFDADNGVKVLSSGQLALNSLTYTGQLENANISDTLTIGSSSTVDDGALSTNVSLLGSSIALGSETTGNYVQSISTGNGIQGGVSGVGSTPALSLSDLTANWNQTAAFDLVLDNTDSQLRILDDAGTYYGEFNVTGIGSDQVYNFGTGGVILSSGNIASYATTGVTAGAGLVNGGTTGTITLDVGAGNGLTVNANDIEVDYGSSANTAVEGNTTITISAGTGLSGGGLLTLGAGGTVTLNSNLGDTIDSSEIVNGTIQGADLESTNSATDTYVLTYDSATDGFTYVSQAAVGSAGGSGVTSLNSLTGALSINGNSQISVAPSGTDIDLSIATGSIGATQLGSTAVTASSYGSASQVATFTVDGDGRLTAAGNTSISIAATQVTSGTLSVSRGGTGVGSHTSGGILLGNGTSAIQNTGVLTNGQLLIGDGSGAPTVATLSSGSGINITNGSGSITIASTLGTAVDGSEIVNGSIEAVDIESTNVAGAGTDNYLLSYDNATGGFTYVDGGSVGTTLTEAQVEAYIFDGDNSGILSSGTLALNSLSYTGSLGVSNGGTGLTSAGAAGGVYYSTGTAFANSGVGTSGQCLLSSGAGAPTWGNCGGSGAGAVTLQVAYDQGNTITTTNARNIAYTLANTATDSDFVVNIASGSSSEVAFQFNGSSLLRIDSGGIDLIDVDVADFSGATVTFDAGEILETEIAQNSLDDSEIEDDSLTSSSLAANSVDSSELSSTTVGAGSYGTASSVSSFTVDADGRLTAASNTPIAIAATQITSGQLNDARLSANVALLDRSGQTFTGANTFSAAGTALTVTNNVSIGGSLSLAGSVVRSWSASDTDVDSLVTGTTSSGTLVESPENAHFTIGLRENGADDSFSIISGDGNYSSDTTYDKVVLRVNANGATTLGGNTTIQGDLTATGANLILGTTDLSEADLDALDDGVINLNTETTGTLSVGNGGTGTTTLASGVLFGNGTSAITSTGTLSNGQLLIGDGSGAPSLATLTQGSGVTITNGAGSISIASTLGTSIDSSEITNGSIAEVDLSISNSQASGWVLTSDGSGGFTWVDPGTVGSTLDEATVESYIFDGDNSGTLSSGTLALDSLSYTGDLNDAQISNSLTITAGSVNGSVLTAGSVANGSLANSSITVTTGNGLTGGGGVSLGGSLGLSLSALTANWDQTGAYDIVLNNAASELQILESVGGTYYGTFDVGNLSSNQTFTFLNGGTVVTSSNTSTYATTGVTAGSGLTGGGTTGVLGVNVGAGTGITVNADDIEVDYGNTAGTAVEGNTSISVTAGTGLSGGGSITLGSGGSVSLQSTLGTNIDSSEIVNGTIQEVDLEVTNAGTDNYLLSYDSATGGFTWVDPTGVGVNEATVEAYIFDGDNSGTLSSGTLALNSLSYTGSLGVSNGGTGLTSAGAAGGVYYSTGTGFANSGAGTSGNCLVSNGAGAPSWGACGGGAGLTTLQVAYDNGSNLTTTNNRDIEFVLADTTTDSSFIINLQGTGNLFDVQDAGTSKLTVDGAGNVGINDASPGYNLDVNGTFRVVGASYFNGHIDLGNATTDNISFIGQVDSDILPATNDTYSLGSSTLRWQDLYLGPASLHIGADGDEGVLSYNTGTNQFNFDKTVRIDAGSDTNGGLLVNGTSQPNIMIANAGTIRARLAVATVGGGYSSDSSVNDVILRSEGTRLLFNTNGGGASSLAVNGADVGIGTQNPNARLQVNVNNSGVSGDLNTTGVVSDLDSRDGVIEITNDVDSIFAGIRFAAFNAEAAIGASYDSTNNSSLIFGTESSASAGSITERMRIQSSGDVGIGTASPTNALHVYRTGFSPTSNDDTAFRVEGSWGGGITFSENANRAMIWSPAGNSLAFGTGCSASGCSSQSGNLQIESGGDIVAGSTSNGTTNVRQFKLQSEGFAVVNLKGDTENSAGEPGGAGIKLSVDNNTDSSYNGLFSMINSAGTDGVGGTYTGTASNSLLLGTVNNYPLQFGVNSSVALTLENSGTLQFPNNTQAKINLYSTTYGLGVSGNTLQVYSDRYVDFNSLGYNGTTRVVFDLDNGNATFNGTLRADNGFVADGNTVIDNGGGWHRAHGDTGFYIQDYTAGIRALDVRVLDTYENNDFDVNGGDLYVRNSGTSVATNGSNGDYTRIHHNGTSGYIDATGAIVLRSNGGSGGFTATLATNGNFTVGSGSLFADNFVPTATGFPYVGASAATQSAGSACRSGSTGLGYAIGRCSSLQQYKDYTTDIPYGLDTLRDLRPVKYKWNIDSMEWDIGFIAEEVNAVNPIFNEYADGELSGVKYSHLTALITKAVQQLDVQVQSHDTRLSALESSTTNLTKKNITVTNQTTTGKLSVTGTATLTNLKVTGATEVADLKVNGKIISAGSTPTAVLGVSTTGNGSTYSISGNDTAGSVEITTGTDTPANPLASGVQASITFTEAYSSAPRVTLTPTSEAAAEIGYYITKTTSGFKIRFTQQPQANTTYSFDYQTIQ